ncbi:MAG: hypothetical protein AAF745_04420, partial [Planctomycetota bacterium]
MPICFKTNRYRWLNVLVICVIGLVGTAEHIEAQYLPNSKHADSTDRFSPIETWLPTPNAYRTASGAPGPDYWQQRADYNIEAELNDQTQT